MDKVITKTYKGADIEIIVEDDLITTAKLYIGNECREIVDVIAEGYPNGVPFDKDYIKQLQEQFKDYINQLMATCNK